MGYKPRKTTAHHNSSMRKHRSERSVSAKGFKVMLDKQCHEKSQYNAMGKGINVILRCLNKMSVRWSRRRLPHMTILHSALILYVRKY